MSKQVTISVPDILHKRMRKWKGSLNFSQICQVALEEAIETKENYRKRSKEDTTMRDLINRLKEEKMEKKNIWFDFGISEGRDWVNFSHYDDIQKVVNAIGTSIPVDELIQDNEDQENYFKDGLREELDKMFEMEGIHDWDYSCEEYQVFEEGWIKGVREFWEEIKDEVED